MSLPPQVEMFSVFHILWLHCLIMSLALPPTQTDLNRDYELGDDKISEDESRSSTKMENKRNTKDQGQLQKTGNRAQDRTSGTTGAKPRKDPDLRWKLLPVPSNFLLAHHLVLFKLKKNGIWTLKKQNVCIIATIPQSIVFFIKTSNSHH